LNPGQQLQLGDGQQIHQDLPELMRQQLKD
jgi:hypothetical protein